MSERNPFFSVSTLPYQAPPFDVIDDSHYRPAFDEGVRQQRAEIRAIIDNPQPASFANTLEALEQSGQLLARVTRVFFAMAGAHTNPYIQSLDEQFSAELAELGNDIWLNAALFQRVNSVYEQRDALALDSESYRLLTLTWQRFVHAGATLAPEQQAALRALNTEAATLQSQFQQRLLGAAKSGGLVVDYRHQLAGLSDEEIAAAADAARERGLSDRWLLTLTNTTQQPQLLALRDRQTRENLFAAGWTRNQQGDEHDTRDLVLRLAAIRAQQAELLGAADYASWALTDQMAASPAEALGFMRQIAPAARARAERELADIQQVIDNEGGVFARRHGTGFTTASRCGGLPMPLMTRSSNPILPSSGCCKTASSGRPRSSLVCALLSASIYRSITRMCGSGRSSITTAKGWRCFTVTTTLVTQRAAAHGWMCLSNSRLCARSAGYLQCLQLRPPAGRAKRAAVVG